MNGRQLVVGIGSAHGDDRAGWQLIDELVSRRLHSSVELRKASVPHDMIDWMDARESLHIVDACESETVLQRLDRSQGTVGTENRSRDGAAQSFDRSSRGASLQSDWTRSGGSHQLGVVEILELAESLGLLPQHVTVWAIPGREFQANEVISQSCKSEVERCADLIQRELES